MPRKNPSPELPAESSGAVETEKEQSLTGAAEPTIAAESEEKTSSAPPSANTSPEPDAPVMPRLLKKAEEEAENGTGAPKGPHPYEYNISAPGNVPEAYRDGNYDIDTALIDDHLQRCHDIGTTPQIPGLLIGRRA